MKLHTEICTFAQMHEWCEFELREKMSDKNERTKEIKRKKNSIQPRQRKQCYIFYKKNSFIRKMGIFESIFSLAIEMG